MRNLTSLTGELKEITGSSPTMGWMCDEVAFLLYAVTKFTRPAMVVQIGHLWGKSALMVLEALHDGFLGPDLIEEDGQRGDVSFAGYMDAHQVPWPDAPVVVSVDIGLEDGARRGARWLADRYPGFELVVSSSAEFLASARFADLVAASEGKRVLAVVDGDHDERVARADMEGVLRLSRPVIFLDDTRWCPHLAGVARDFAAAHSYQRLDFPLYNGVALLYPEAE